MKFFIAALSLCLASCASSNQKYSQERMPASKSMWIVRALEVPCKSSYKECKENVKKTITMRGKKVCKKQPFTVLGCEYNESSSTTIVASCKVRCGAKPEGREPGSVHKPRRQKDPEADSADDASHGFDWQ